MLFNNINTEIRCVNCGMRLSVPADSEVVTCKYCDKINDISACNEEEREALERAVVLRNQEEFEAADSICKGLLLSKEHNHMARWQRLLCKYGVVYIEQEDKPDKRIITFRKSLEEDILNDEEYKKLLNSVDLDYVSDYRKAAKEISITQKKILEGRDIPCDIFICYKETDNNISSSRTIDSYHAEVLYDFLTNEGYDVFFARETLMGKLGADYEAAIYNAIANAKVMIVIGTKKNYLTSTWVKSEWTRFLKIMEMDSTKRLIPVIKNMDPERDLPEELRRLQVTRSMDIEEAECYDQLKYNLSLIFDPRKKEEARIVQEFLPDSGLAEANALYDEGKFDEAEKAYERRKRNNKEAYYHLGSMYYSVPEKKDDKKAFEYFEKAAKKGHKEAMYQLGFFYEMGIGVTQNKISAKKWYREAGADESVLKRL